MQNPTRETSKNGRNIKMASKSKRGWVAKKLSDPKFREAFEFEYERLSIGEQIAKLRNSADLTQ